MRSSEIPFLADWIAITLRWLMTVGIILSLALSQHVEILAIIALSFLVLWNIYITFLAVTNRRMVFHRQLNVAIDTIAAAFLFYVTGGFLGPLNWIGLLPLLSSALYYELIGALLQAIMFSLLACGLAYLGGVAISSLYIPISIVVFINLVAGIILGLLARRLMKSVRAVYHLRLRERKDTEIKAQQQEHDRMQGFYNLISTLSASLNYQVVLDTALDLCATALAGNSTPDGNMVSAMMLFSGDELRVGSARRFTPADMRVFLPGVDGILGRCIDKGEPQQTNAPAKDPEVSRLVACRSCQTVVCVPLRSGLNSYGLLLFGHTSPGFFTGERVEILEIISQQAVMAIQNARLYQDLDLEKRRLIETQEEARKKLARDLHDGPIQSVAAIAMRIEISRHMMAQDPVEAVEELLKVEDMARRTTKELRHMLFTLRPLILESQGLVAALESMAQKMKETFDQNVIVEVIPTVLTEMEIGKQTVVFYLVEESINNARKHAQANHIWVRLKPLPQNNGLAFLEIADDGVGFDPSSVNTSYESRGSLGMVNLKERTELVSGVLHIDSAPGKGTRVQILIPLNEVAADLLQRNY